LSRTLRAIALGAALALALPGAAFAATVTAESAVTATVAGSISLSGVPATYSLGTGIANTPLMGPDWTVTVTSSDPFSLKVSTTAFTSGANTIPRTAFLIFSDTHATINGGDGTPVEIATTSPVVGHFGLNIPPGAPAGTYTATVTFTATN